MRKSILLLGAAFLPFVLADAAGAQDAPQTPTTALEEVIVTGRPVFRNRTDDVVPTLSYDLEYFQRFEPLTVGDALRRVPSVTFLSDVLESDGVRMRGLDSGYTQILINGERVPGGGDDRSFFVDRIPAELIERVEVVRSSSANRSGDAVAGAINIVLRDAYTLDGGYIRGGAILFPDDEVGGTFGAVYGGQALGGRLLVGASVQDRRNPKDKYSQRFDRPGGTLDNTEVQTDVRSGTDYSFNADYQVDVGGGELSLSGVFVRTERLQDEDSIEYRGGREQNADLLTVNDNNVDIETDNLSLRGRYEIDMLGGETRFKLGYASFDDHQSEFENEAEYLRDAIAFPDEDRFTADFEIRDLQDEEWSGALEHTRPLNETTEIEFGVQAVQKDRESITDLATRIRFTVPNAPAPRPVQPAFVFTQGTYAIEETRIDPYVMLSGETGALKWEAGLRYETTDTTIAGIDNDYAELLPSASLRYTLNDTDRLIVSAGRTIRRPKFNDLAPGTLEEERGDNDFRGNPLLEPETAWGADVGIERRLGLDGVVGLNVFYRDVTNLIEDVNTGLQGSGGAGTFIEFDRQCRRRTGLRGRVRPFDVADLSRDGEHGRVPECVVARQQGRGRARRAPVQRPVRLCRERRLHARHPDLAGRLRRDLSQAGRCLRSRLCRGGHDKLRRRPGSLPREAAVRQRRGAPNGDQPAGQRQGRGVRQVRRSGRPDRPQL
ncbi:Vitamin B12 transporter BtuB [Brevundimonas subvibrioides]